MEEASMWYNGSLSAKNTFGPLDPILRDRVIRQRVLQYSLDNEISWHWTADFRGGSALTHKKEHSISVLRCCYSSVARFRDSVKFKRVLLFNRSRYHNVQSYFWNAQLESDPKHIWLARLSLMVIELIAVKIYEIAESGNANSTQTSTTFAV